VLSINDAKLRESKIISKFFLYKIGPKRKKFFRLLFHKSDIESAA
jgi:hypothetical protein